MSEFEPTSTELEPTATERGVESGYPHTLRPELHKALESRGIDYWVAQGITFWNRDDGCECLAYGFKASGAPKLAIKVVGFTDPEQAIAATLGDADATQGRQPVAGTMTAEQVRSVLLLHLPHREYYSIEQTDAWQALADELNATLGAGTCHMRLAYEEEDADGFIWPDHYECDACGANVNGIMTSYDTEIQPRYCPNCGAKVVDA